MHNISIFGTSSDAGKSTLTWVIAKLLQKRGIRTVPFKAQNVSNNSQIADDGSEIAISTFFQASVLGVPTSWHINPVLLKSGQKNHASLIVKGEEVGSKDVKSYYHDIDTLKPMVVEGFSHLDAAYDCVVAEGAGGCVELNLLDKDLSNTFIADRFKTKIILVADIEKGGVFASIYGTVALLQKAFQDNLIGVVINKFRGDRSLFDEGVKIIEERFGLPVLGVLPYTPFHLGFEDSQSLMNYVQHKPDAKIKVGILRLPYLSNFTDFEPLMLDSEVEVTFTTGNLHLYDLIILPGSKRVVEDLLWLKEQGLFAYLQETNRPLIGICGGYEMLFERILDPKKIESEQEETQALGRIPSEVIFEETKIHRRSEFHYHDSLVKGYEIHYARAEKYPMFYEEEGLFGTFLHGIFESDAFRDHIFSTLNGAYVGYRFEEKRAEVIDAFVETMGEELDMERIVRCIS